MDARGGLVGIITPPAPAAFATARRLRYHAGDMAEIDDLDSYDSLIDARTPGEYAEDHIPGAINLPALSDRERARIGALHKEDAFAARHEGARLMVGNLAAHFVGAAGGSSGRVAAFGVLCAWRAAERGDGGGDAAYWLAGGAAGGRL